MTGLWLLFVIAGASGKKHVPGRFVVHLCSERYRDHVSSAISGHEASATRHLRSLGNLPAILVRDASKAAVEMLWNVEGVCDVSRVMSRRAHGNETLEEHVAPHSEWWHLDRINQEELPLDGSVFRGLDGGDSVNIVVLDTGLDTTHDEFSNEDEREVLNVASMIEGEEFRYWPAVGWLDKPENESLLIDNDVYGHGTHTTGMCGGRTLGIAPRANLYHIKVLSDNGFGSTEGVVSAFDAVAELVASGRLSNRTIVSVSLGGDCEHGDPEYCKRKSAEAKAVNSLSDLGVAVVVSAGNSGDDACFYSPAAAYSAVTVGASDYTDVVAWWSNYGSCVDVVGPGVDVALPQTHNVIHSPYYYRQTYVDDDAKEIAISSGTSFSAPAVSGALALYSELTGGDMVAAINAMINRATTGVLIQAPDLCPTNDRFLRAPPSREDDEDALDELDVSPVPEPDCADPEERPGWPYFSEDDVYSFSFDYSCYDSCGNCTDILNTSCGGSCSPWDAEIIYEIVCEDDDDDDDDDDDLPSFSFSYSYEEEEPSFVRPLKATRRRVSGRELDRDECAEEEIEANPAHHFDKVIFAADAGSYVSCEISDCSTDEAANCTGFVESANSDGILAIATEENVLDPTLMSVTCRVCNNDTRAILVNYGMFAVYASSFNQRDIFQDTSNHLTVNETVDFEATESGKLQLGGECSLAVGDSLWSQARADYDEEDRSYRIREGTFFSVVGEKSVYPDVEHVRCTVLFNRQVVEPTENVSRPAYAPTTLPYRPTIFPVFFSDSDVPTMTPSLAPTSSLYVPTIATIGPSYVPTNVEDFSSAPSFVPSVSPLFFAPSSTPTSFPSFSPVQKPTALPTRVPSEHPSAVPTALIAGVAASTFTVAGISLADARANSGVFTLAIANLLSLEDESAVDATFKDLVVVDYAVSIAETEEHFVRETIFELTPDQVTSALRDAARSLDQSALFSTVVAVFVDQSVQITYSHGAVGVPTADDVDGEENGGGGSKKKGNGGDDEGINVLVVAIVVAGTVALALAATAGFMAYRRRQNQRYFLARSGELIDPAFEQNSVEMT